MVERLDYKLVGLGIVLLLGWMAFCPPTCRGAVIWADDFNDGNYDGWTICENPVYNNGSQWSATSNYLQLEQGTWSSYFTLYWGIISYPSSIAYGTWSFDFKFDEAQVEAGVHASIEFISSDLDGTAMTDWDCYWIYFDAISISEFEIKLRKNTITTLGTSATTVSVADWHHIDVTRTHDGLFSVYHNGVLIIQATDTEIDTSELFVLSPEAGAMFDNIVVRDDIPDNSWVILLVIGGSVAVIVVVIVVVIVFLRRRRTTQ